MNGEENLNNKLLNKVEDFFVPIKTRLSNSWVVSFTIAWAIINWQPILYVILAKEPILDRFVYVEETYYNSSGANWWFYFFLPLLIGAFYAFVFPFIEPGMEWATLFQRRLTNDRNHDLLMNDLVNQEKLALKKAKVDDIVELSSQIDAKKKEIATLLGDLDTEKGKTEKMRLEKEAETLKVTEGLQDLTKANTIITRLENELNAEKQKVVDGQNQITSNLKQIKSLNTELNEARNQIIEESKKNGELATRLEEMSIENTSLKSSEEQLSKMTADLNRFRRENISANNKLEEYKVQLEENKKEAERIIQKNEELVQQLRVEKDESERQYLEESGISTDLKYKVEHLEREIEKSKDSSLKILEKITDHSTLDPSVDLLGLQVEIGSEIGYETANIYNSLLEKYFNKSKKKKYYFHIFINPDLTDDPTISTLIKGILGYNGPMGYVQNAYNITMYLSPDIDVNELVGKIEKIEGVTLVQVEEINS